jgi:NOL1/NOP2/fmu family ribosome biogenesis protein
VCCTRRQKHLVGFRLSPESILVSNEIVRTRAEVLEENISRWGAHNCIVTHNHPKSFGNLRHFFDLVVIDAPCSGEGMFRKDPKVIQHWSPKMVQHCALRQKDILNAVVDSVAPGGRLVYSTCTYNPTENEDMVQWLLHREPGQWKIVPLEFPEAWGLTPGNAEDRDPDMKYTYHCYPHKCGGEGFYFACLEKLEAGRQRMESPRSKARHAARKGPSAGATPLAKQELPQVQRLFKSPKEYAFFRRGDVVEAVPLAVADDYAELSGSLNMLKGGIKVGDLRGGKFVPDHDLAMAHVCGDAVPVISLDHEHAMRYLSRDELQMEVGEVRDWALVAFDGLNLGWVKVLDARVNNHLPKQLRIRTNLDYSEFE